MFFQCSTSLVIKSWICFVLFDVIQKGTTQCFEIFYLFVCLFVESFLFFLCAVKALILWGALWARAVKVFWLVVVVFLLLRATTRWKISDAVFWWPENQNAVFSTCETSEGTSSEDAQVCAATISLPNSSRTGSQCLLATLTSWWWLKSVQSGWFSRPLRLCIICMRLYQVSVLAFCCCCWRCCCRCRRK